MNLTKKIMGIFSLCVAFATVLMFIYGLNHDRLDRLSRVVDAGMRVDDYHMIARSLKYGLLIIAFTFAVFFFYEVLNALKIHPMQYILVGLALSIFYLLLLSFAEKIGFTMAYLIASIACISQIVWYLQYVLRSRRDVLFFGALLVVGYAVMYVLLCLSAYSLILGSVVLFFALFAVMYITRNVDWYHIEIKGKKDGSA